MLDDLTVLGGLSLKQLLNHHHTLSHHSLCKDIYSPNTLRPDRHRKPCKYLQVKKVIYHLCWRAVAPDRWDKCLSPRKCWWRTCRWPEWWLPQTLCPGSSHRSEIQNNKHKKIYELVREVLLNCRGQLAVIVKANLKFPQNDGDVCFSSQVGQDFQLQ